MKVTPKNVFILENGKYKEITYNELQKLEQTEKSYTSKRFLPLHGMLMEVTEETYKWYYKDKRRQNYVDECSRKRGDFSYNALDTKDLLGEDILEDKNIDIEKQVENKIMLELLSKALKQLSQEDRELIQLFYFQNNSERKLAKELGVSRPKLHSKLEEILYKIRKFMKN